MGIVSIYTQDNAIVSYTEDDFFIVNRASVIQNDSKFPTGIQPYATIEFSGYVQAYIFRGDVLNEAGFIL